MSLISKLTELTNNNERLLQSCVCSVDPSWSAFCPELQQGAISEFKLIAEQCQSCCTNQKEEHSDLTNV